ncbi:MAG: hypothetical protein ACLVIY_08470 [Anaerobutyricum soehngenii]
MENPDYRKTGCNLQDSGFHNGSGTIEKSRHNFEFSQSLMLVFLTIICILLLSVSAVLKDAVKPLSAVAETVVIPTQDGINSFGVWVGDHYWLF